ncbi:hypothetical protein HanRHA438_Chr11g0523431 [Helianthus annuus]|nr:hypothetical protein HanRHA438_Chr11g0523431 [Helianthus annuus]
MYIVNTKEFLLVWHYKDLTPILIKTHVHNESDTKHLMKINKRNSSLIKLIT